MVQRDRNHPSVVLWSIGNEIPDVFADSGGKIGPALVARIHALDVSRPDPGPHHNSVLRSSHDAGTLNLQVEEPGLEASETTVLTQQLSRHNTFSSGFPVF